MATKWGILVFECNSALLVALCIRDNADRADTTQSHEVVTHSELSIRILFFLIFRKR